MDITSLIMQQMAAQQQAKMRPDKPPARMAKQPGYATRFVKGKWVLVPVNGGTSDPALVPRVTVKPLRRPIV